MRDETNKQPEGERIQILTLDHLSNTVMQWWENNNPFEDESLYTSEIIKMYLVGSRAKGTERDDSDYDVAVVFPRNLRGEYNSIKLSEMLHASYGWEMPDQIDIQIFFEDDFVLKDYSKINLQLNNT